MILDKPIENIRDKKLLELYSILTKSDLKGSYDDTYTLELAYALMCLDLTANDPPRLELKPKDFILLAKELVRIVDIDGELDKYSMFYWARGMTNLMRQKGVKPKDIHKMSTFDLKNEVTEYCEDGE